MNKSIKGFLAVFVSLLVVAVITDRIYINNQFPSIFQAAEYEEFIQAKAKWESASISNYIMNYELEGGHSCKYTIERSASESISESNSDNCRYFVGIESMFREIENHLTEEVCGPNGCQCDGRVHVFVDYDPVYGYPSNYGFSAVPGTGKPSLFDRVKFGPQICELRGMRYPVYVVTNFEIVR